MNRIKTRAVLHCGYGGFNISRKALDRLIALGCKEAEECLERYSKSKYHNSEHDGYDPQIERNNPLLIKVIEELGESAGKNLEIIDIEIPIEDHDGYESINL